MCGIAGVVLRDPGQALEGVDFLRLLGHRGPDDEGHVAWDQVRLFHRRLSILDLTPGGRQPMWTADGRRAITFNGEIYNFVELRDELERLGHRFRSRSDTEVLLAAWGEWGPACLERLVGMFAFALLDTAERALYLVRDFFGIKPLYYCRFRTGLAFASEIPPLLRLPGVSRRVHAERLYRNLRFGITDEGGQTLFADVQQVPPGHFVRWDLDTLESRGPSCYWALEGALRPADLSFREAAERLRDLFLESVRLHLRSDVPVGSALSGGIDSSAIVMAMRRLEPRLEIHAFSFVADDPEVSEERWVDLVACAARALVHKVRIGPQDLVQDLDELIRVQGEPFGSTSIYAQFRVFRRVREIGIKVVLDGQGADELLAGYIPYTAARVASLLASGRVGQALALWRRASRLPGRRTLWQHILGRLVPGPLQPFARRLAGQDLVPPWLRWRWFAEREVPLALPRRRRLGGLRGELLEALTSTSLPMLLRYEDRNSMAHSVESRVPFLTPQLASFILSLPEEYIVTPDGTTKAVFREAMRGIVPGSVLERKDKIGFATPERRWLTQLAPWVEAQLAPEALERVPVLDPQIVREEWRGVLAGSRSFDWRVWRWLNLLAWARAFEVEFA